MSGPQPGWEPYQPPGTTGDRRSRLPAVMLAILMLAVLALVGAVVALLVTFGAKGLDALSSTEPPDTETAGDAVPSGGPVELAQPLEIRPVDTASPGPCPDNVDGITVTTEDEPVECLELGTGFSVDRLDEVSAGPSGPTGFGVRLALQPDDAETLAEFTREYAGERAAFIYDEEVIMSAHITGPIEGGTIEITGDFDAAGAERLAERLTGRLRGEE